MMNRITNYLNDNSDRMDIPLTEVVNYLGIDDLELGILINQGVRSGEFRLMEFGQGYHLVLESSITNMYNSKKMEALSDLKSEIMQAVKDGDDDLASELSDLLSEYSDKNNF